MRPHHQCFGEIQRGRIFHLVLKIDPISESVIQELVAPEVALQPTDIQTVGVIQTIYASQLHGEPDFIANVLGAIAVQGFRWASRTGLLDIGSVQYG